MNDPVKTLSAVPNLPDFYSPTKERAADKRAGLEFMEARFSAIPGQPSIVYYCHATDTVVSICPVPQVGLVAQLPDTLNFVAVAHRTKGEFNRDFTKDQAAEYLEQAANLIDFGELVSIGAQEATFNVALDSAISNDFGTGYRGILCIPVSAELLKKNVSLAILQGQAAQRVLDLVATTFHTTH
jgi:hypothetical protein